MQKSFIERVFPKPKRSILPLYDESSTYQDEDSTMSPRIGVRIQNDIPSSKVSVASSEGKPSITAAPLSASVIHHDNPFLAVDRATQNLQKTIQSLLDLQSRALGGRTQDGGGSNIDLHSDATPTQSTTGHSNPLPSVAGTIPIRQPKTKVLSLRGARRNLTKSMHEFAALKEEELKIVQGERTHRETALKRITELEDKREAVQHDITVLREQLDHSEARTFRSEAEKVEKEIHELEGRLMELKARQRHLIRRAEQVENTTASELSSYEGTLKMVDKETRAFLRHPPVPQALNPRRSAHTDTTTNMYLLTANRRNLAMAKEQWNTELENLTKQEQDVQQDREALVEGVGMWRETITRVEAFEQDLRRQMKMGSGSLHDHNTANDDPVTNIIASLHETALFLQQQLKTAQSRNWNLLICAIGAELEAFRQARRLLAPDEPAFPSESEDDHDQGGDLAHTMTRESESENSDVPHADLLSNGEHLASHISNATSSPLINTSSAHNGLVGSNESLKATLKSLAPTHGLSPSAISNTGVIPSTRINTIRPQRSATTYSESEDDDPSPDFFLSH